MPAPFSFAICNELFRGFSLEQTCSAVSAIGYSGLEIAPFTLAEDANCLSAQERRKIKETLVRHSLSFVGFHWLLASPPGLRAVASTPEQRHPAWAYLAGLIDLAADLADEHSPVLVFGSPKQRSTDGQVSREQANLLLQAGLAELAPHAEARNVSLLLEPLSADQCDTVNSVAEAVAIVEQIGSPAIQTMFDVHNAVNEPASHSELVRRFFPHIRHIHLNEMDGREPGAGTYNFAAILQTLSDLHYSGWISLEIFDFERDPQLIAKNALRFLEHAAPAAQDFAPIL